MRLRNKKTGEIREIREILIDGMFSVSSLTKLNEEWEDYKENKYYYAITSIKVDNGITKMKSIHNDMTAFDKSIGNYFKTKEEAEKAVEKLKAWKRLKDKDFQFHGHNALGFGEITFSLDFEGMEDDGGIGQLRHDLDLLFGEE